MNQQQTQMATPISNLPLKTAPPQDQTEIEDPLIQNVLKEFEDDMNQQKEASPQQIPLQYQPLPVQQMPPTSPHPVYAQPQQYQPQPGPWTKSTRKLIDMKIAKNTAIIAIIVFLLQNYNIIQMLVQRLPETVTRHIVGKEFILNFALIFAIFYALMYFDFI